MNNEPFWMVFGQGAPTFKHESRDLAETEAKRLARLNPGVKFYVLETVSCAEKIDVRLTRIDRREVDPYDDGVPF